MRFCRKSIQCRSESIERPGQLENIPCHKWCTVQLRSAHLWCCGPSRNLAIWCCEPDWEPDTSRGADQMGPGNSFSVELGRFLVDVNWNVGYLVLFFLPCLMSHSQGFSHLSYLHWITFRSLDCEQNQSFWHHSVMFTVLWHHPVLVGLSGWTEHNSNNWYYLGSLSGYFITVWLTQNF